MTTWQQPSLFDHMYGGLPPHQKHSDTSKEAALTLDEAKRNSDRGKIMRHYLVREGLGATDDEVQHVLNMHEGNTERPRRRELEQAGLIYKTKQRRLTCKGKPAFVYVATGNNS